MYHTVEVSVGQGCHSLKSTIVKTQDGLSIYIGGGEKPHIGTVVISQPRSSLEEEGVVKCTSSVINILGHKDEEIAIPISEKICRYFKATTVVTAGVHIDNASIMDIEKFKSNGEQLLSSIIKAIEGEFCKEG